VSKNNLKKIDIIKNLNFKTGYSLNLNKKLVNDLIELLIKNIKVGNFNLKNIGSFRVINKKQRFGRNPKTKEEYIISPRKSVSFTASKKLSQSLKKIYE
tara:strand:- start:443 stop:739 length:297 start_codon:yes stop_codon:yes gene_type:complete